MKRLSVVLIIIGFAAWFAVSAAGRDVVRIALDWTPNTNHTGIVVAQALGFFEEEDLEVEIVQPGPTASIQLTASGQTDFGVSMQEYVTMARAEGIPVVSIAAVFPHNTSGFASPLEAGILSPADFEGKRYGGWGSDLESVMIRTVMDVYEADASTVEMITLGMLDFTTAVRRDFADFYWIFYGWQGIHASLEGVAFNYLPLTELSDALDYYTPVIIASERMISQSPEVVRRFVHAIARGYTYAVAEPAAAADALLAFAPELDPELVHSSQAWLVTQAIGDIEQWGRQRLETWSAFAAWAYENGLIEQAIIPEAAFTNVFLPAESSE